MPAARRSRLTAVLALVVALAAFPMASLASHQFADVPDSNPFHADISAIANAGVTSGCGGGNYCPDRNVTRAEMAAFMNRLGALAAGKTPVVNATKLDGLDSGAFLQPGEIVHTQYGPWAVNGVDGTVSIVLYGGSTRINRNAAGSSTVQLAANGVISEHGVSYGFKELELCFSTVGAAASLTWVEVDEFLPSGNSAWTVTDFTLHPLTSDQCFTYSRTPTKLVGSVFVFIELDYTFGSAADITTATWTWAPTTTSANPT